MKFPTPYGRELESSIYADANRGHNLKTRRSISGLLLFVGRTPVGWSSRRQTAIATSTYEAEFMALRSATEEAKTLRFALRCFGVPVNSPTIVFGDNLSVIQNANNPDAVIKKKHVAISFHLVREAIAAKIIAPSHVYSQQNFADILTKPLPSTVHIGMTHDIFWKPEEE